jgi:hypothetical protein
MAQLNQGMTGTLKSVPKLTRINGDDNLKVIYRNMGNNHAYPFVWASTHAIVGGADTVVASGVKFHGYDLASYASTTLTVTSGTQDGYVYIAKDTTLNTITVKSTGSNSIEVDIQWMLGEDPVISGIYCRGNDSPTMPALP